MLAKADAEMSDEEHVERLREIAAIEGATAVCLQQIGDAGPVGSIRRHGELVLPHLR